MCSLYPLVPWLCAWPPWWLYWCLCLGGWWLLHLGRLLLWWTPCCLSFAVRGPTSCPQRAIILPSEGHHLTPHHHLVHHFVLLAHEEQPLHPAMTLHHQTPNPLLLHHHVKGGLSSLPGTNILPKRCCVYKNISFIYKNICKNMDTILLDEMEQVQSCAVLVGGHGGCLVTSVLCVTACPPLGQCPLWGLCGVLVYTLGPNWRSVCAFGCSAVWHLPCHTLSSLWLVLCTHHCLFVARQL